jgi:hypothetical protein
MMNDDNGKPRVDLGVYADRPALAMHDASERAQVWMGVEGDELGFAVDEGNGRPRAKLLLRKTGNAGLIIYDGNRRRRAEFGATREGPILRLLDGAEGVLFSKP